MLGGHHTSQTTAARSWPLVGTAAVAVATLLFLSIARRPGFAYTTGRETIGDLGVPHHAPRPTTVGSRSSAPVQAPLHSHHSLIGPSIVALVGVVLAVILVVSAVRWLMEYLRDRRRLDPIAVQVAAPSTTFAETVEQQHEAMRLGTPTNAIIACWVAFERTAAEVGVPRRPAETSGELAELICQAFSVDRAALQELAELYGEARFSDHPLQEAHRDRAIAALQRIRASLDRQPIG
ncbi:DUF4129 domain-containing protein [Rudaeicoccus suwonensis]|uniref:Uncharacterized protein DUF4129 n=1 Tax=Rudaeicoccus suwonensis TaxID=657409 RepID=A0A561ECU1_9MICO|nr:DUF4129 domain-containing protein [Rudaeicoccus suwonensis]TWE13420.1 uncharacterized protein DUF4129 [Rudaeicoccus suwonensis]